VRSRGGDVYRRNFAGTPLANIFCFTNCTINSPESNLPTLAKYTVRCTEKARLTWSVQVLRFKMR